MRLVALIILAPVSLKTDVTTSSYEGFQFCIDARECLNQTMFEALSDGKPSTNRHPSFFVFDARCRTLT